GEPGTLPRQTNVPDVRYLIAWRYLIGHMAAHARVPPSRAVTPINNSHSEGKEVSARRRRTRVRRSPRSPCPAGKRAFFVGQGLRALPAGSQRGSPSTTRDAP